MDRRLLLVVLTLMGVCVPATAGRLMSTQIVHETQPIFQAYPGNSYGMNPVSLGYGGVGPDAITAVPGVLAIVPGERWSNFVSAARAGVAYGIKNVVLRKQTPEIIQCADVFPVKTVSQQGTINIRLWWPLMYEIPGTTWTLNILYGTTAPWDDDGPGPNPMSYVHAEAWTWRLEASFASIRLAIALFHQLPFGLDQAPLISDELLPDFLLRMLDQIEAYLLVGDYVSASLLLGDFEMAIMDAYIAASPEFPKPTGPGTGIANSIENPACCKLLADAEYVGFDLGILQPGK